MLRGIKYLLLVTLFLFVLFPSSAAAASYKLPPGSSSSTTDSYDKCKAAWDQKPETGGSAKNCTPLLSSSQENAQAGQIAGGQTNGQTSEKDFLGECRANSNVLGWIVCPVADNLLGVINGLEQFVFNQLTIKTNDIFDNASDKSRPYYEAWSAFRSIALGLIVIAALVMVVSQAAGAAILDAYTIRKVLPRLLIAIVFIALSWNLMEIAIQFSNDMGHGMRALIYSPFQSLKATISAPDMFLSIFTGFLGVGTWAAISAVGFIGVFGILTLILGAVISVLIAFGMLLLRQMLVIFLIIFAPVAIACYILPNTQKVWSAWKNAFISVIVIFPIISALFAIGRVFAAITLQGDNTWIDGLIALFAYCLPLFLLMFAFRMAGGVLGTITGMANDKTRGVFDRMNNYRSGQAKNNYEQAKLGNRFKRKDGIFGALNKAYQYGTTAPENLGTGFRANMRTATSNNNFDVAMAALDGKIAAFNPISKNEDFLLAGSKNFGNKQGIKDYLARIEDDDHNKVYTGNNLNNAVDSIMYAQRYVGADAFKMAAAVGSAGTGTGFMDGGSGEMLQTLNEASGGNSIALTGMYAKARSMAMSANRADLGGYSFGAGLAGLAKLRESTDIEKTKKEVTETLNANAVNSAYPGQLASSKKKALEQHIIPAIIKNLQQATSRAEFAKELATVAGEYDVMSQLNRENAATMDKNLLSVEISNEMGRQTVQQWIEDYRTDSNFTERRREYGASRNTPPEAWQKTGMKQPPAPGTSGGAGMPSGGIQ